ncbi:YadA-like family protein [Paraburkholderia aspalathi]|uniref:YadA-like family protein n=1 Tax=Paraburkholderia aspalathi TaxID=1324617 RepID=UPI0038BA4D31
MNKIYKAIWNRATGTSVAAPETAKARSGKSAKSTIVTSVLVAASGLGAGLAAGDASAGSILNCKDATAWGSVTTGSSAAWGSSAAGPKDCITGSTGVILSEGTNGIASESSAQADLRVGLSGSNSQGVITLHAPSGIVMDGDVTMGGHAITNLKNGAVSSSSSDAVNGAQLYATNQNVTQNTNDIAKNAGDITNIDSRVTNVEGSVSSITNQINNGGLGLVQQDATSGNITVAKDAAGTVVDFTGTAGARKLTGLSVGELSATSTDAVNGSQLYTTNQNVAQNSNDIAKNTSDIAQNTNDISKSAGDIAQNTSDIAKNAGDITNIDSRVTNVEGSVSNITNQINNGELGLVQQDATSGNITVAKDAAGTVVDFTGTAGARKLTGLSVGELSATSTDAVNGSQLYTTNQNVTQNTSDIAKNTSDIAQNTSDISKSAGDIAQNASDIAQNTSDIAKNAGDITNIDSRVTNVEGSVSNITNQINNGELGLVQQDATSGNITVAKDAAGTVVDFTGTAGTRKLTGLSVGELSATSTDAVNGSQLYATNQNVAQNSSDIVKNTGDIAQNASDIAQNTSDISKNTGDIAQNASDIAQNTSDITKNTGEIAQNASDIAQNTSDISKNTGDIAQNASDIAQNTSDIAKNAGDITKIDSRVTNVEGSVTDITNQLNSGEIGLVQQDSDSGNITVAKGAAGSVVDFTGTAGTRKLTGLSVGELSATSTDAVNGSQLYTTNQNVAQNTSDITKNSGDIAQNASDIAQNTSDIAKNAGDITKIDSRVTNVEGSVSNITNQINNGELGLVQQDQTTRDLTVASDKDGTRVNFAGTAGARELVGVAAGTTSNSAVNVGQLSPVVASLGGGAQVNADGSVTGPMYHVQGGTQNTVGGALDSLDNGLSTLQTQINNGSIGMVTQNQTSRDILVGAATDGLRVNMAGTAGNRVVTGVAAGAVNASSSDAVNGAQLHANAQSTADALGGGSTVNEDGTISMPTYNVGGTTVSGVGAAITNIDGRVTQNTSDIASLQTTVGTMSGSVANAVSYDSAAHNQVTLGGSASAPKVKLTNLQDGELSATSSDAVTGSQLWNTNQQVANLNQAVQNQQSTGSSSIATDTGGPAASATGSGSMAMGGGAQASGDNSVALGAGSVADQANTVSVGSPGNERRITNVADGQGPTDAVNMRQFQQGIGSVARNAYSGVAAATALTMIPDVDPGKTIAVGVGTGNYKGYQAVSLGMSARITQNLKIKAGAGISSADTTYGVGAAYQW